MCKPNFKIWNLAVFIPIFFLAACRSEASVTPTSEVLKVTEVPAGYTLPRTSPSIEDEVRAYTHIRPDGNHLAAGRGTVSAAQTIDIPLRGQPNWLVGMPYGQSTLWIVTLADGEVQVFEVSAEGLSEWPGPFPTLIAGEPPHVRLVDGALEFAHTGLVDRSTLTHPIWTPEGRIYLDSLGALVREGDSEALLPHVLPDARLLTDEDGRLLMLTDPTDRYDHAIAGDALEAASFTLFEAAASSEPPLRVEVAEDRVIESVFPLWADLDGDGQREIVTTESDLSEGARIVVYQQSGDPLAESAPIGLGYRWRHVIAAGAFGPAGEIELVEVVTPHLGRVVTFHRLQDGQLTPVASLPGYTSHAIGSRNLDMAATGDFDGDGELELLLVSADGASLVAIQRSEAGAIVDWSLPLPGRLTTNLATLTFPDGLLGIAAGTDSNVLRLWLP